VVSHCLALVALWETTYDSRRVLHHELRVSFILRLNSPHDPDNGSLGSKQLSTCLISLVLEYAANLRPIAVPASSLVIPDTAYSSAQTPTQTTTGVYNAFRWITVFSPVRSELVELSPSGNERHEMLISHKMSQSVDLELVRRFFEIDGCQ
jgi:hypothetical protein